MHRPANKSLLLIQHGDARQNFLCLQWRKWPDTMELIEKEKRDEAKAAANENR